MAIHEVDDAIEYLCGYISRRAQKFSKCDECQRSLIAAEGTICSVYFEERNRFNGLIRPSSTLVTLVQFLENCIQKTVSVNPLNSRTFFDIAYALQDSEDSVPTIGCWTDAEHQLLLTKEVIQFYLIVRMYFMCKFHNKENKIAKSKINNKKFNKLARVQ